MRSCVSDRTLSDTSSSLGSRAALSVRCGTELLHANQALIFSLTYCAQNDEYVHMYLYTLC